MVVSILGNLIWFSGFTYGRTKAAPAAQNIHQHEWGNWENPIMLTNAISVDVWSVFVQLRRCTNCGLAEARSLPLTK